MVRISDSPGARVLQLRTALGLSQREFAQRSGLTNGHISLIENRGGELRPTTAKKIADAFSVPADWILFGGSKAVPVSHSETLAPTRGRTRGTRVQCPRSGGGAK